nr:hypothetical protein [Pelagicoccus albus]
MSPEERLEKLEKIGEALATEVRPVEPDLLSVAPSPFSANLGHKEIEVIEEVKEVVLTDDQVLEALADQIKPSGVFNLGGEYFLMFKDGRRGSGSQLKVSLNDSEYIVLLSDITGVTYQLRYKTAELQRELN